MFLEFYFFLILKSLEGLNGGLNLFINLILNKQLAEIKEKGAYQYGGCQKEFNKNDLIVKSNNVYWPANYPASGIFDNVNKIICFFIIN